jgi:hypothetical protein
MARIDLGDDDSADALADALKQLEAQQKRTAEQPEPTADEAAAKRRFEEEREAAREASRGEVADAVAEIRERQAVAEPAPSGGVLARVRLALILAAVAAFGAAAIITLRPEPLPPPALTAREAVRGFWSSLIEGHYEGATVFYPSLVDRYASRRQAALFLEQFVGSDPPMRVVRVGEPESLAGSGDVRVSWEVTRRSGRPWSGEFIVRDSGSGEVGCVIIHGT